MQSTKITQIKSLTNAAKDSPKTKPQATEDTVAKNGGKENLGERWCQQLIPCAWFAGRHTEKKCCQQN